MRTPTHLEVPRLEARERDAHLQVELLTRVDAQRFVEVRLAQRRHRALHTTLRANVIGMSGVAATRGAHPPPHPTPPALKTARAVFWLHEPSHAARIE